jgi:hypothetical protein
MTKLSLDQVVAFRVERQFLHSRAPAGSLFEVASAVCGVRAQLPSTAELTLWARVDGLEQGEVKQALEEERTLVKDVDPQHAAPGARRGSCALRCRAVSAPRRAERWLAPNAGGDEEAVRRDHGERPARARRAAANARAARGSPGGPGGSRRPRGRTLQLGRRPQAVRPARRSVLRPPRGRNVTFVRPDRWLRRTLRADPEQAAATSSAVSSPPTALSALPTSGAGSRRTPGRRRCCGRARRSFTEVEVEGRPRVGPHQ